MEPLEPHPRMALSQAEFERNFSQLRTYAVYMARKDYSNVLLSGRLGWDELEVDATGHKTRLGASPPQVARVDWPTRDPQYGHYYYLLENSERLPPADLYAPGPVVPNRTVQFMWSKTIALKAADVMRVTPPVMTPTHKPRAIMCYEVNEAWMSRLARHVADNAITQTWVDNDWYYEAFFDMEMVREHVIAASPEFRAGKPSHEWVLPYDTYGGTPLINRWADPFLTIRKSKDAMTYGFRRGKGGEELWNGRSLKASASPTKDWQPLYEELKQVFIERHERSMRSLGASSPTPTTDWEPVYTVGTAPSLPPSLHFSTDIGAAPPLYLPSHRYSRYRNSASPLPTFSQELLANSHERGKVYIQDLIDNDRTAASPPATTSSSQSRILNAQVVGGAWDDSCGVMRLLTSLDNNSSWYELEAQWTVANACSALGSQTRGIAHSLL